MQSCQQFRQEGINLSLVTWLNGERVAELMLLMDIVVQTSCVEVWRKKAPDQLWYLDHNTSLYGSQKQCGLVYFIYQVM